MFPLLARRQKALFWREAPPAVFAVLVKLPLGVIFGFLLLAFVVTLAGHPGAELAADGVLNALAFVGLAQGSILLGVALVTVLCFIDSVWRVRAALWPIAAGLFAKTPALMSGVEDVVDARSDCSDTVLNSPF